MNASVGGRLLRLAILAFAVAVLFALFGAAAADPDLWGHVRFGQLIRELGFVPRHDPYAYTEAGRSWINHEWLAEWVLGGAWDLAGARGLVVLRLAFIAAVFGLAADFLRRRGVGALVGAIMVLLAALPLRTALATVRPHLFTVLLFLVVLLVLRASRRRPGVLWLLPPVFALWVNAHGGVLAGLGVAGIWFAVGRLELLTGRGGGEAGDVDASPALWAGVGLASAAALLVNPYGIELPRFLLETATVPRPHISEWTPLRLASRYGVVYLILLGVGGGVLLASRSRVRVPEGALLAVGALLPLVALRHLALFGLVWLVVLADHGADLRQRILERSDREMAVRSGWGLRTVAVVVLSVLAAGLAVEGARGLGCIASSGPATMEFPRETVRALERTEGPYRLAVHFSWGEYAIWHLGPRIQVSMDGRRETVYPDATYAQHFDFLRGSGDWSRHLESPPADLALVERGGAAANLLELSPDWTRWTEGRVGVVYARDGVVASLPSPADGVITSDHVSEDADDPRCFPE